MTIRQLAAEIGVSKTTVAAALRNNPAIKLETRKMVQARARELGYEFNPVASAFLQQVRSKGVIRYRANLALILPLFGKPDLSRIGITTRQLHEGILERAAQLGYTVDCFDVEQYTPERLSAILSARGVLGIAVGPLVRPIGHLSIKWSKFATAAFGYSLTRPAMHRVVHNHWQGIRVVFKQCRRLGYQRIGLVLNSDGIHRSNELWTAAYAYFQQKLPPEWQVRPLLGEVGEDTPELVSKWIANERPEVIIFHNSLRIPAIPEIYNGVSGEIPVVVLDRLPTDPYAGINQRYPLSGAKIVDILSSQILHNERGIPKDPSITMIVGVWVSHPSLKKQE